MNASIWQYLLSKKAPERTRLMIHSVTGYIHKDFPLKYLGVPLVKGRFKIGFYEGLIDKIINRINGWRSSLLSAGGRLVLIK